MTSNQWSSLKLKLAKSLLSPASLHTLQLRDQSVVGEESSALHGIYCCLRPAISIVKPSSVRILTHWLVDMVRILRGVSRCTYLMVLKKDGGR